MPPEHHSPLGKGVQAGILNQQRPFLEAKRGPGVRGAEHRRQSPNSSALMEVSHPKTLNSGSGKRPRASLDARMLSVKNTQGPRYCPQLSATGSSYVPGPTYSAFIISLKSPNNPMPYIIVLSPLFRGANCGSQSPSHFH